MSAATGAAEGAGRLAALLVAQFLSALADNALLFGAIALLKSGAYPAWAIPALQSCFVAAYILLAPVAGPLAEAYSKRRVLVMANGLKLTGALGMALGLNPFLAYGLVGIGAAAYSPAKYGILGELVGPARLVRANGILEASTIVAILAGALLGGVLADWSVGALLWLTAAAYAFASLAAVWVPRVSARSPEASLHLRALFKRFGADVAHLWTDNAARTSLLGTSLFWGAGATLRLLLVAWVPVALLRTDTTTPAALSAVVAIGIAIGAGVAAKWIQLERGFSVLPAGVAFGSVVLALAGASSLELAVGLLILVGAVGGFYVVPLNAILQDRGHARVGAGPAIAVQNLWENGSMLLLLGAYSAMSASGALSPVTMVAVFGGGLAVAMAILWRCASRPVA